MEAYFDNSATTRVLDSVKDIVVKTMTEDYGNPAAKHRKGMEAEQYIREAKKIIADSMKVQEKEILFTSGGSESNNMALIGTAWANQRAGKHIISTAIEHPSVYNPLGVLEELCGASGGKSGDRRSLHDQPGAAYALREGTGGLLHA